MGVPEHDGAESREERVDRAILEYLEAADAGQSLNRAEFLARHSELAPELKAYFADHEELHGLTTPLRDANSPAIEGEAPFFGNTEALPGSIGGYQPVRLLGAGGMGRVYEARDSFGRHVALKLIAPRFAGSPSALQRFRQEGRLAGQISHPRSVFVFEADEEAGQPYIAMELMSGETLKDLVELWGPLDPVDAIHRIFDVIEGLEQAHELGVIHRDVKPANCYLDGEGRVKIGDFGLARSLGAGPALTQVGGFIGTPLFASPEQIKGDRLDARADVYSVAATLYYLLTGRAPFGDSDGAAAVARIASEDPPPPRRLRPEIPLALEKVLLKGLERSAPRRYATLGDFREALQPFLPREMTIAGLGLRLGALCLDVLPFWLAAAVAEIEAQRSGAHVSAMFVFALQMPLFFFFWLFDGFLGATPGKWLVGLRVTRAAGGTEPAGPWLALHRTIVFLATGGVVSDLVLATIMDPSDRERWILYSAVAYLVSLALRFSTMRASNGYRGIHEFASGTRVVQRPAVRVQSRFVPLSAEGPPRRTIRSENLPVRLGGFLIRGAMRWDDDERILAGEDPSLGRRAWIQLRSERDAPILDVRRKLSRPTRLRWLGASGHGPWSWEAFVAPSGRPLSEWVASVPLGWGATRHILEQLTEELAASLEEGNLPESLALDQVWIRGNGAVELLDISLGKTGDRDGRSAAMSEVRALDLLRGVANVALSGRAESFDVPHGPIRAIVPLHARRILDRLSGVVPGYGLFSEWQADLLAIHDRPTESSTFQRAIQVGLLSVFLFFILILFLSWSRIAAAAAIVATDRTIVSARTLLAVLDDDVMRRELTTALPAESLFSRDPAEARRLISRRCAKDREELAARIQALGPLSSMPVFQQFLDDSRTSELERIPGQPFAVRVRYPLEPIALELELYPWHAWMLLHRARKTGSDDFPSARLFVWTLVCLPLLILVAVAFIGRGGLTLRQSGLALVRADGRQVSRLRAAWRAFTIMIPFLAVLWLIVRIDTGTVDGLWLVPVPFLLAAILLLVEAALALCFPRRTIHDWLAGTYVVPR